MIRLLPVFVLLLLAAPAPADPLTVDLAGDGWAAKRELSDQWSPVTMPTHLHVGEDKDRWVDFRRTVTVPRRWDGQVTLLRVLSINDGGEVFVDGKSAGTIDYGMFPAEVDVSNLVTPGRPCEVTLRAFSRVNYYVGGHFPSGSNGAQWLGVPRGVSLEIHPAVYLADVVVRPSVNAKQLDFDVYVVNKSNRERTVSLDASLAREAAGDFNYPKIVPQTVTLPPNERTKVTSSISWTLGEASYWWPNIPFDQDYRAVLHNLDVTLSENKIGLDRSTRRFGFREAGEGPTCYTINGVRVFQFLDSSQEHIWSVEGEPTGWQTAYQFLPAWGTVEGATETWHRYQRLGINTFRLHGSEGSEAMMRAADETGMMLVGESAMRGWETPDEEWDYRYKPASVRAMARWYRGHPSVVRYSLVNEYGEATKEPKIAAALIDAAVSEDATRPLSLSQDFPPREAVFYGSDGKSHAWVMQHYYRPKASPDTVVGVEEAHWDREGSKGNELIRCARDAILDRLDGYAVFGPWNINNYWCNFVEGGSYDSGTIDRKWKVKDRRDGVDGWGSDLVKFVQNCYSIYAAADVDMIRNHLNTEELIFAADKVPSFENERATKRELVVFNNSLSPHKIGVVWELHMDSPGGEIVGRGRTPVTLLKAGDHATPSVALPLPSTGGRPRDVFLVLRTEVDGEVRFEEDRYFFRVTNR